MEQVLSSHLYVGSRAGGEEGACNERLYSLSQFMQGTAEGTQRAVFKCLLVHMCVWQQWLKKRRLGIEEDMGR